MLTRGGDGATIITRTANVSRPTRKVKVADTVGAGDASMGGLLAALSDNGALSRDRLQGLVQGELEEILDFALTVAAITCSRIGADPPTRAELKDFRG
jgi:fructokinase